MSAAAPLRRVCELYVDDLLLGVDAAVVQEVMKHRPSTAVPLADDVVSGLVNLRGQIVVAIDLRRRLGLPPRDAAARPPMDVVVRTDAGPLSLVVDRVGDVIEVDPSHLHPPPETVPRPLRDLVSGTLQLPDRLLLVVHAGRAFEAPHPTGETTP